MKLFPRTDAVAAIHSSTSSGRRPMDTGSIKPQEHVRKGDRSQRNGAVGLRNDSDLLPGRHAILTIDRAGPVGGRVIDARTVHAEIDSRKSDRGYSDRTSVG